MYSFDQTSADMSLRPDTVKEVDVTVEETKEPAGKVEPKTEGLNIPGIWN